VLGKDGQKKAKLPSSVGKEGNAGMIQGSSGEGDPSSGERAGAKGRVAGSFLCVKQGRWTSPGRGGRPQI